MTKIFRFSIVADINWETGVDKALNYFEELYRYFETKNYGTDLEGISLVLMCRSSYLNFRQRKNFSKKDKTFYFDIMLDYDQMLMTMDEFIKAKIISKKLNDELFPALSKYKFKNLDLDRLQNDLNSFIKTRGLAE